MSYAELSILNVGDGDTRLTFDPSTPVARERAKRIVMDMLRRGYVIVVRGGVGEDGEPWYSRVKAFDPETCEYLIEGLSKDEEQEIAEELAGVKPKRGRKAQRLAAASTPAVAVARGARGCARESW